MSISGNQCRTAAAGDATIIRDGESSGTQCFQRMNFGLNGVVDARQCGVIGDGLPPASSSPFHPDDGALLQLCLDTANIASHFVPVVNTGGGVILDNDTLIIVPYNVELTCGGGSGSGGNKNDFRITSDGTSLNISNALVIAPQMRVNSDGTPDYRVYAGVVLQNGNSALSGCLIVAGNGGVDAPNLYAPSVWYPGCDSTADYAVPCTVVTPPAASPPDIRSALYESKAFYRNGYDCDHLGTDVNHPASCTIGVLVGYPNETEDGSLVFTGGSGARIRDVTVLGFGTCLKSVARDLTLEDCRWDCATALDLKTPDVPFISNVRNERLLTGPQG